MKLVGNYSRSGKNENFETEITLTIRENYKHLIQDLDKNELYSIVISKAKDKRTEQQNKYMWALIGEIDKARNGDRSNEDYDIYLEALVRAGAKYTHLLVEPQAESMLRESFRAIQLVRKIQVKDKIFNDYKCFYGSSKMDKKEMHDLIETILDMASECGLDIIYWKDVLDFGYEMGKISQKDIVLNHLKKYGSISTMECYEIYRITDLQHAIYLLRKENYNITDEWISSKNKLGWANKYKKYTLVES